MVLLSEDLRGKKTIFQGYTLEDQFNEVKIQKETRIPAGKYEIIINRTETPKTKAYQVRYNWFKYHLQLANVPGFQGIYIHIGNTDRDTEGCLLMADNAGNNVIGDNGISSSTECFKRFYNDLYNWLDHRATEKGKYDNQAFITILDEKTLIPK
jgi:hypothetical protein